MNYLGDDHYRQVAEVYLEACEFGPFDHQNKRQPATVISQTWHVSPSTGRRWTRVARERGFLPPATMPGRAGEAICRCRCPVHCPVVP